ncbi:unnamed protein product [Durusdinium trenchii]|uniref:HMG box domain-containing protein n=1 Tax=Durusdinium trenchii TaxID=1381693 RepID=A0ABP0MGK9_9DINO
MSGAHSLSAILAQHGFKQDLDAMLDRSPEAATTPSGSIVPNPSPTNPLPKRAGPSPGSSAEKTAKPAPAPVQGGSDKKKTLSSEAISGLKGQIAEGLQQVNQNKKDSRKANQSAAKAAAQALSASLPTRCTGVPKESKGKGTEVTKVKGARAKDAKPKRKMRKPAAAPKRKSKAKEVEEPEEVPEEVESENALDSEEELSSGGGNSPTLRLGESPPPKKGKKTQNTKKPEPTPKDAGEGEAEEAAAGTMRDLFWQVVHQKQREIKRDNPELSAREVLKLAKMAWHDHPMRLNCIKNMTPNERSKRALTDSGSSKRDPVPSKRSAQSAAKAPRKTKSAEKA